MSLTRLSRRLSLTSLHRNTNKLVIFSFFSTSTLNYKAPLSPSSQQILVADVIRAAAKKSSHHSSNLFLEQLPTLLSSASSDDVSTGLWSLVYRGEHRLAIAAFESLSLQAELISDSSVHAAMTSYASLRRPTKVIIEHPNKFKTPFFSYPFSKRFITLIRFSITFRLKH